LKECTQKGRIAISKKGEDMKRIFLLVLMFSMFAGAVYADECISGDCQNGQGTTNSIKIVNGEAQNTKYVGEFKNGKPNGKGTITFITNGGMIRYTGDFKNGFPDGQGGMKIVEGSTATTYVGQFKRGEYNGQGTLTDSLGQKKSGLWKNGNFISQ